MRKVLITGANGYIGSYLKNALKDQFHIVTTDMQYSAAEDYFPCDLLDKFGTASLIKKISPEIIVHCAGTKDLFGCEKDPDTAYRINVDTTKNLIDSLNSEKTHFVFLSSDYVFKGDKGMYSEGDIPEPETVYGKTKLMCEEYIQGLRNYTICRTANVYGRGSKFFSFILDSLEKNEAIRIYQDSCFSPTYIGNLSDIIGAVIKKNIKGILHTAGKERIDRYNFAVKIAKSFNYDANLIKSASKPEDSPIAKDSSLDVSNSEDKVGIRFTGIDEGLEFMKAEEGGCTL